MNQQSPKPVHIVVPGQPPAPPPGTNAPWYGFAAGVAGLALGMAWWRWRAARSDPAEKAFKKLARRLGLNRAERRAIRRAAGAQSPVSLLLSREALEAAAASVPGDPHIASAVRKLDAA